MKKSFLIKSISGTILASGIMSAIIYESYSLFATKTVRDIFKEEGKELLDLNYENEVTDEELNGEWGKMSKKIFLTLRKDIPKGLEINKNGNMFSKSLRKSNVNSLKKSCNSWLNTKYFGKESEEHKNVLSWCTKDSATNFQSSLPWVFSLITN